MKKQKDQQKISCIRVFADQVQIKGCKNKIQEKNEAFSYLSQALELAGNEVRLKILYLLKEEGKLCVCDISDILSMKIPAISQHLRKLKDGNIIEFKKAGQTIYYSLRPDYLKILKPFFNFINQNEITYK